ncbi:MAG: hypothetical protein H0U57_01255 [Tatlockia sp.]|nr:hypothetical protein [Tatlockia sp.]
MILTKFNGYLPESINFFIQFCQTQNIKLVMHGSAISDYFTHNMPNDYDFYILSPINDFLEKVATRLNIQLKRYEKYIIYEQKKIFYFINQEKIKIDLNFIDPQTDISELNQKDERVIITISSLLFNPENNILIDEYHGIRDMNRKDISCYQLENFLDSPLSVKCFVSYLSHLHGKFSDFSLMENQLPLIKQYLQNKNYLKYYEEFSWQRIIVLTRVLSHSNAGIINAFNFWKNVDLVKFFFSGYDEFNVEKIFLNVETSPLQKIIDLSNLSKGKFLEDFAYNLSKIPVSYYQCIPQKTKSLLLEIKKLRN